MMKKILAGTIALTLAGAGLALAQQSQQGQQSQQTPPREQRGFQMGAEDMAALTDARVASLKAGLKLTAEQEKNWPAVEAAIRDLAQARAERMKERAERIKDRADRQSARPDAIGRLRQGADAMTARAAGLKKIADAAEPLYKSLDEGQKHRFALLLRMGGHPAGGHRQRRADLAR